MKLDYLTNALNVGHRDNSYHTSQEDAQLALDCAIKLTWLEKQGINKAHHHLKWYDTIQSRDYDKLTLDRLKYVLNYYQQLLIGSKVNFVNEQTIEFCSGMGRNIRTIIDKLKPNNYVALDMDEQCIQEIEERWSSYTYHKVTAIASTVSQYIQVNQ